MNKIKMGPQQFLNPKPVVLAGTFLDGKANFITVSWIGISSANPPTMCMAIRNIRYSLDGFKKNKTFSVNIPSAEMVKETDFCGSVSGLNTDKVKECNFNLFNGVLDNAPMIDQCPLNMECKISKIVELGDHSLIIGEIIESYVSGNCVNEGIPDIRKINPLCFCTLTAASMGYYGLGDFISGTGSV